MKVAKILGMVGRSCISAGVLTLLFVLYQLWGTGIREAQAQNKLRDQFADVVGHDVTKVSEPASFGPPPPPRTEGDAVAHLVIRKIGVDKIVVQGVTLDDLKRGPGHYPNTPLPGQAGNAAIAGHRTTYGAPFNRIDELDPGDEILVATTQGAFRYEVSGTQIVSPSQVEVLNNAGDNRLTLTACHPKYSAAQRIVVTAKLTGPVAPGGPAAGANPAAEIPGDQGEGDGPATIDGAGLSGEGASAWPAILLGVACAFIWVAAWLLGQLWRRWPSYFICLPLFLVMLFYFFENFSRLLPANY